MMNPFSFPANAGLRSEYSPTMCERTLGILRRTVFVSMNPDWSDAELSRIIAACRAAATGESSPRVAAKAEALAQSEEAPN